LGLGKAGYRTITVMTVATDLHRTSPAFSGISNTATQTKKIVILFGRFAHPCHLTTLQGKKQVFLQNLFTLFFYLFGIRHQNIPFG
jgi:hypothetical protein